MIKIAIPIGSIDSTSNYDLCCLREPDGLRSQL